MNPFAAFRQREKKAGDLSDLAQQAEERERSEREKACFEEVEKVLGAHNCTLRPTLKYTPFGILPDAQIVALAQEPPKPTNERPTEQPATVNGGTPSTEAGQDAPTPGSGDPQAPAEA